MILGYYEKFREVCMEKLRKENIDVYVCERLMMEFI